MKAFVVGAIYFKRTDSLLTVLPDGRTAENGGHWKCLACQLVLLREETPVAHAMVRHLPERSDHVHDLSCYPSGVTKDPPACGYP